MIRLSDTQLILLSTASQRESQSIYPLPDTIADDEKRRAKVIDADQARPRQGGHAL